MAKECFLARKNIPPRGVGNIRKTPPPTATKIQSRGLCRSCLDEGFRYHSSTVEILSGNRHECPRCNWIWSRGQWSPPAVAVAPKRGGEGVH
jgi:hypothetical protein